MTDHRITAELLEAYRDGALDDDSMARISASLRHDPNLRAELAAIDRTDRLITDVLLAGTDDAHRATVSIRAMLTAGAIATAILIAVGLLLSVESSPPEAPIAGVPNELDSTYEPIRIVLELPGRPIDDRPDPLVEQSAPAIPHEITLAAGIPQHPRSFDMKELASQLDALSFEDQLACCRAWAYDPRLRPLVFDHLRRLSLVEGRAEPVAQLAAELAANPELNAWVRSYSLPQPSTEQLERRGCRAGMDPTTA